MKKKVLFCLLTRRSAAIGLMLLILAASNLCLYNITVVSQPTTLTTLKGKKIVIDPGHGGIDGGAVYGGLLEKEINLSVARQLAREFTSRGARVVLTRDGDVELDLHSYPRDLQKRVNIITANQPDLFLCIHVNANHLRPETTGAMVFYNQNIPNASRLADSLKIQLDPIMTRHSLDRHQPTPADYYILRNVDHPGVIVELGFLTNQRERQLLQRDTYQRELVLAIVRGVAYYFDFKKNRHSPADRPVTSMPAASGNRNKGISLYFPSRKTGQLMALPLGKKRLTSKDPEKSEIIYNTVSALLAGPGNKELLRVINPKTKIRHLKVENGIVTIDLSQDFTEILPESQIEYQVISSLVETITQFDGIRGVRFLIEGQKRVTLAGHQDLSRTLLPRRPKAMVALVIDDLAGGEEGRWEILKISRPLTLAVLPNRAAAHSIAQEAVEKGYQVLAHIPMEPEQGNPRWLGDGAITSGMNRLQVRRTVLEDLALIPGAVGINNHMGSRVTRRKDMMQELLSVIREQGLLVMDSRTTDQTVLAATGRKMGIPVAERTLFLDEVNSFESITDQIRKLAEIAVQRGSAVGVGHVGLTGRNTARAIKEMIPWLEDQGIAMVFISEVAN